MRIYEPYDQYSHGTLALETQPVSGCTEVFYVPSREKLQQSNMDLEKADIHRVKLLEIDEKTGHLTILPINTLVGDPGFLGPKYTQIKKITLAYGTPIISNSEDDPFTLHKFSRSLTFGPTQPVTEHIAEEDIANGPATADEIIEMLESLPPAFTKDYDYGLGLAKPYRFIVEAVEELSDCTHIFISEQHRTEVNEQKKIFYISHQDFETIRKFLNSTTTMSQTASRSVKKAETHNFFAEILGRPKISVSIGRHRLRGLFTRVLQTTEDTLSSDEQEEVLSVITKNAKSIAEAKSEKLAILQSDIDLVNLEVLIARYEEMMTKVVGEPEWQAFLNENPFILSMAFGYPIVKVQDQASVGGRKLSGKGEKLADFLVKNSMTNNTAIIEIKTPSTKLLNKKSFREGVYTPSTILSGSINQVLDQKYQFEREIASIKENSQLQDIKSYSVHCCLIIGTMLQDEDQKKSFEFFRGNSKDVEIITFDELLLKLKKFQEFLSS